ncbi:unnamed protein product [Clavelina lepadiformis]|uniref:EGF-like domain-containing protein n=1 Tax=Clavelina lepadiformis TaxID=159417 RepID=A0ABP0GJB3_CLALP
MKTCIKCYLLFFAAIVFHKVQAKELNMIAYEASLLSIMNEDVNLLRQKRAPEGSGGCGDFQCGSTESQTCTFTEDCSCDCVCKPGYYSDSPNESGCSIAKVFGGKVTFVDVYNETKYYEIKADVEATLDEIYNKDPNYRNVTVTDLRSGSTVATYELYYANNIAVDDDSVKQVFNDTVDCSTDNRTSSSSSLTMNVTKSCNTVIVKTVLCDTSFSDVCDEESTTCTADSKGYVSCPCKDDTYYQTNGTICIKQICTKNNQCNSPFGSCSKVSNGANYCQCMWGFSGAQCYQPWMFTLTVVAAGCGLIIIILIITLGCYCKRPKKKKPAVEQSNSTNQLKYPFSDFQPGAMRARVPGNEYASDVDMREIRSSRSSPVRSNGNRNGYTNHGYAEVDRSSSTFGAPKRTSGGRHPDDYF